MTIILTGKLGLLGHDIEASLKENNLLYISFSKQECDITNLSQLEKTLNRIKSISYIINCAAYTQVDACETNKEIAKKINSMGTKNLALYAKKRKCSLIHFSTDYIFDGTKSESYSETDQENPINYYGKTKQLAEHYLKEHLPKSHYCFRVQWLFGQKKNNFITTISTKKAPLTIVNDQWGTPTWTKDIAKAIIKIIKDPIPFGTYHMRNEGYTNWYDYAKLICNLKKITTTITPSSSSQYKRPAKRPLNGKLNNNKLKQYLILPDWKTAVKLYLKEC